MRARDALGACLLLGLGLLVPAIGFAADEKKADELTPQVLRDKLAAKPEGDDAEALAKQVRAWFGKDNLPSGGNPKVDGLEVAWAIEAPDAEAAEVVSDDESFRLPLLRLGKTDVFAATVPVPDGTALRWAYRVDGKPVSRPSTGGNRKPGSSNQLEVYLPHPDSLER